MTATAGERFSPFAHRDFLRYLVSSTATGLAMEMSFVAIGWQVYDISRRPLDLGLVGLAMFIPLPILALPAGHLADRHPRRTILAGMLVIDALVGIALLVITHNDVSTTTPFFVLAFVIGIASALGAPASRALVPSLVPEEDLGHAFAMNTSVWQVSVIVGPAFGGLLYAIRPELVYGLAAALSAVSCVAILTLRSGREGAGAESPDLRSLLAGVRLVRRTPVLLGAISLDLFAVLFGGAVALLPVYARDILDVGPLGLGILRAAPAVGGVLVAVYLHFRPVRDRAGPLLLVVVAVFGASTILFGVSESMALSLLALAIGGGADLISMVLRQQILPLVTPDDLRGRVNAVEMVFISASNELGAFESGVAAALIGVVPAVVIGGAATIVVAGVWWKLFPALARVDRLDELRPVEAAA